MKRYFLLLLVCGVVGMGGRAQQVNDQDIQDSVIGWWAKNKYDHLKPQTDPVARKKEAIVNDMVRWMKASYTPVGGLGTSQRYIGPVSYGVAFDVWNVSHDKRWSEPDGTFKPIPEECTHFYMTTNMIYGSWPVSFINTGSVFYFTMQPDGYGDNDQRFAAMQGADPRIHPNCYRYVTWRNDMIQVYLVPNNKLPWIPVSKRELLDKAEAELTKVLSDKNEVEKYRQRIHALRTQQSESLDEQAVINAWQPDIYNFDEELFKIAPYGVRLHHAFPVYKLDSATYANMRGLKPQWICVAWPFANRERGNQLYEMYTAMAQNINYDYIYNYFFAPERVKGVAYTAADADGLAARLAAYRGTRGRNDGMMAVKSGMTKDGATIAAKNGVTKDGVLLYDDFSQEGEGAKPAGWYYNSRGEANLIATVPGEKGQWLKLGYNSIISSTTLKAFPENFSLEFDLLTGAFDGSWGADVLVQLSGKKDKAMSSLSMEIGAGLQSALEASHNYRGVMRVSLINTPSSMPYNDIGGFYESAQPEFTSLKRKVHVKLLKKGDGVKVFLNGREYANSGAFKTKYGNKDCGDCRIPAGLHFETMTIKSLTQDAKGVGCYIGKVQIAKE